MNNAFEPKTDRELLIMINEHVTELKFNIHEIKEKISQKTDMDFCDRQHVVIEKRFNTQCVSNRIFTLKFIINFLWIRRITRKQYLRTFHFLFC